MRANVHLDTQHHTGPIDRRMIGGFLEHLGRAVYEGVYDPGNPRSDEHGFRCDVLEALRPLDMPVIRYPGGNFVSCYDWKDGIGPREQRPARPDYAWKSIETNQFGTDEFMAWCKKLGTAPMMAVNLGTAGTTEAAQLLEYCNFLVNRSQDEEVTVAIDVADRRGVRIVGVDALGGGDVKDTNTWEYPDRVQPVRGEATLNDNGGITVRIPAPGIAVVQVELAAR